LRKGARRRFLADIVLPFIGFGFCASIWWNLNIVARIIGGIWFVIGLGYLASATRGFRQRPKMIDFSES
jgi:putrescine importer